MLTLPHSKFQFHYHTTPNFIIKRRFQIPAEYIKNILSISEHLETIISTRLRRRHTDSLKMACRFTYIHLKLILWL